jgi:hypothetical protein
VAATLNKGGRAALREVEVSAATDVTGYGFLGHLLEMLEASGLGAVVRRSEVPVWERAVSLAAEGCYPGGLKNNREYLGEKVTADGVGPEDLLPLHDPQTSGGLLVAVPEERASGVRGSPRRTRHARRGGRRGRGGPDGQGHTVSPPACPLIEGRRLRSTAEHRMIRANRTLRGA